MKLISKKGALLMFTILGISCGKQPASPITPTVTDDSSITIEDVRNDVPAFERVYKSKIDERCSLKITMKWYWRGDSVYSSGELDQPDGKWVLFDVDAVAEKILDRTLVPLVQAKVDRILAIDKAFRKGGPSDFIDKQGVHWKRLP